MFLCGGRQALTLHLCPWQAMANVTAESANATRDISATTATAPQTSAHAGPKMGRSAAIAGTASAGSASARSREPLEKCVRSALPAQMLAAPRGNGPRAACVSQPESNSSLQTETLLSFARIDMLTADLCLGKFGN